MHQTLPRILPCNLPRSMYSAPIRTRARAAAEAVSSPIVTQSSPAKKRKTDQPRTVPTKEAAHQPRASGSGAATDNVCLPAFILIISKVRFNKLTTKGPVPCDDKEGHYMIVTDDMIYRRCEFLSNPIEMF